MSVFICFVWLVYLCGSFEVTNTIECNNDEINGTINQWEKKYYLFELKSNHTITFNTCNSQFDTIFDLYDKRYK